MEINIKKKKFEKVFGETYYKDFKKIDRNFLIKKILDTLIKESLKAPDNEILNEIIHSLNSYPYSKDYKKNFKITDYELMEILRIEPKNYLRYFTYRYKYKIYPSLNLTDKFPPCIQIEPTSICNFRCIMCYQSDKSFSTLKEGFMGSIKLDTFKKVIDEIEGHIEAVTLASRGEPTLNKLLPEFLKYCGNKFLALKLNTNASVLTEKLIHELLSSGLQTIVFSIDSANKIDYEKIRVKSKYEKLLKNLDLFHNIKNKNYSNSKIITRISGVKINSNQDFNNMISAYENYADMVNFTPMKPWQSSYDNPINDITEPCTELWRRIFVWQDGTLNPCDYDYKSKLSKYNISEITIKNIWQSDYYNDLRNKHLGNSRKKLYPCNRCISI